MKISFLCNSFLALPSIELLQAEQQLAGLATAAHNTLLSQQVEQFAQMIGIPFATIKRETIEQDLSHWITASNPDAVVVQTFPYLIPSQCLTLPPLGFFNIHPSPLPSYRGPDPIFWQIAGSESTTGVSLHKMSEHFDTGPIFCVEEMPIAPTDTYGLVQSKLSYAAVEALRRFLNADLTDGSLIKQPEEKSSSQPKANTGDFIINWSNSSAAQIQSLIRACNPHQNGAITFFREVMTRILETRIIALERVPKLPAGSVIAADPERGLQVLCTNDLALELRILHVEEGYFTGGQFCKVFEVGLGEKFCTPSFLS